MEKIVITYGTRPLAQRIGRMLTPRFDVVFASAETFPDILLRQNYRQIPTGVNPTYAHELLKTCLDEQADYVLPLGKMELAPLHEARILFHEYGIEVLQPVDLAEFFILKNPPKEQQLYVCREGVDLLHGEKINDAGFSGVGMLSDSEEDMMWCLAD
ncbi:hypothetical protein [Sphingobacterium wenxiniae]|uniref:Uncharacterized protein n=1 Tax=Sphingobacterium wenxiniae TaxID=683125 RepID=A0A1I6VHL1_9SPHI|nr:hypothetical protein [Sphingobacterium wenxiniae]SFT13213.1 hypothetical protein SAMN05660206_1146 [Sphingobacterium wenxiniae]